MTFRWHGKSYDTRDMIAHDTGNPAMPLIYQDRDNHHVFVLRIDRLDGAEIYRATTTETLMLAQRYNLPGIVNADTSTTGVEPSPEQPHRCDALLVEDDGASRHALSRLLSHSGYETSSAATIAEAETKLKEQPRCVILDLNLPDGVGTVLLERIRRQKLPIKVAITTGTTDPELLLDVKELHPDVIFKKPLNLSEVMRWLDAAA